MNILCKSGLLALALMLAPDVASAQCQKCNSLQQNCSWGPWVDGYNLCKIVDGDCVQSSPCAVTVRLDLDGSVLSDPRRAFSELRAYDVTLAAGIEDSSEVTSVAMWVDMLSTLRDCREFRLVGTEERTSADAGPALMSELVL